jgi:glycine/D-amino acid oxidase-like deaminating enzyme
MPKALIVGAGINGLSTAWALCKRGWQVEVFEAGAIPNPFAASADHHRIIRHFYSDPGYATRIPDAFAAWARLWKDLGRSHYHPRGMLAVSRVAGDWAEQCGAVLREQGADLVEMDASTLARAYPMLETEGVRHAMLTKDGGVLMANAILTDLAIWLSDQGVTLHTRTPVSSVTREGSLLTASGATHAGDVIITATGVHSETFHEAFTDCHARRVTVLYVDPPQHLRAAWQTAPCWIDLGGEDDLWGMPIIEGLPMKLGFGAYTQPGDPDTEREISQTDIETVLSAYRGRFKDIEQFTLRTPHVNFYYMAPEEKFRLHANGRHIAVSADSGHGFKFGTLTGEDVAEAVMGGEIDLIAQRMAGCL